MKVRTLESHNPGCGSSGGGASFSPSCYSVELLTETPLLVGSVLGGVDTEDNTKIDDSSNWN